MSSMLPVRRLESLMASSERRVQRVASSLRSSNSIATESVMASSQRESSDPTSVEQAENRSSGAPLQPGIF